LGKASYVIGIEIHRDRKQRILKLSQRAYIEKVLERFQTEVTVRLVWQLSLKEINSINDQCPEMHWKKQMKVSHMHMQ
jgi:hypothetical protein